MDKEIKNYLGVAVILAIILALIASFWYVSAYSKSVVPQRIFTASGEGKVVAVPDVAELSFGVLTEGGKNIGVLQKENSDKVNQIIAFLKENGVDEKDIKTQYYNISPRYQYYYCPPPEVGGEARPCPPSEIVGYSINQSVSVKVRDLTKAGDMVAGVVDRGANTVSGPTFTIDDPTEFQNQAREEAMKKAKAKAEAIAKAAGFKLGKLISVQEGISVPSLYRAEYALAYGKGGDGAPVIEPGSQEVNVSVTLTYEIR